MPSPYDYVPPRRSGRVSGQPPKSYGEDVWETDFDLQYPELKLEPVSPSLSAESPYSSPTPSSPLSLPETNTPPRSSHTRKRNPDHIPRPPNAFLIFRSEFWAKQKQNPIERDHRQISRIAGHCWRSLSSEERAHYKGLAEIRKNMHAIQHPGYKYSPNCGDDRPRKKSRKDSTADERRCAEIAARLMSGSDGEQDVKPKGTKSRRTSASSDYTSPIPSPRRRHSRASGRRASSFRVKTEVPEPPAMWFPPSHSQAPESPDVSEPDEFVPTSEIPPLDLNATPKLQEKPELGCDTSVVPHSYHYIDSQFGYQTHTEDVFWSENEETIAEAQLMDFAPSPSPEFEESSFPTTPPPFEDSRAQLDSYFRNFNFQLKLEPVYPEALKPSVDPFSLPFTTDGMVLDGAEMAGFMDQFFNFGL